MRSDFSSVKATGLVLVLVMLKTFLLSAERETSSTSPQTVQAHLLSFKTVVSLLVVFLCVWVDRVSESGTEGVRDGPIARSCPSSCTLRPRISSIVAWDRKFFSQKLLSQPSLRAFCHACTHTSKLVSQSVSQRINEPVSLSLSLWIRDSVSESVSEQKVSRKTWQ